MTFQESDLKFQFSDADWQIIKYDAHRYFKILSGAGLKGIDFLGIYQGKQVVFFEVKNFHTHQPINNDAYQIIENTPEFIESIIGKMEDTLSAIKIVIQYLQRKWWYRLFLNYQQFIPTIFIQQKDWYFWHRIQALISDSEEWQFVLWLEIDGSITPAKKKALRTTIQKDLAKKVLSNKGIWVIANMEQPAFTTSLKVKAL